MFVMMYFRYLWNVIYLFIYGILLFRYLWNLSRCGWLRVRSKELFVVVRYKVYPKNDNSLKKKSVAVNDSQIYNDTNTDDNDFMKRFARGLFKKEKGGRESIKNKTQIVLYPCTRHTHTDRGLITPQLASLHAEMS